MTSQTETYIPMHSSPYSGAFRRAIDYFVRKSHQRATYNALVSLSDRELHDIGIHRTMIPAVAAGHI